MLYTKIYTYIYENMFNDLSVVTVGNLLSNDPLWKGSSSLEHRSTTVNTNQPLVDIYMSVINILCKIYCIYIYIYFIYSIYHISEYIMVTYFQKKKTVYLYQKKAYPPTPQGPPRGRVQPGPVPLPKPPGRSTVGTHQLIRPTLGLAPGGPSPLMGGWKRDIHKKHGKTRKNHQKIGVKQWNIKFQVGFCGCLVSARVVQIGWWILGVWWLMDGWEPGWLKVMMMRRRISETINVYLTSRNSTA